MKHPLWVFRSSRFPFYHHCPKNETLQTCVQVLKIIVAANVILLIARKLYSFWQRCLFYYLSFMILFKSQFSRNIEELRIFISLFFYQNLAELVDSICKSEDKERLLPSLHAVWANTLPYLKAKKYYL